MFQNFYTRSSWLSCVTVFFKSCSWTGVNMCVYQIPPTSQNNIIPVERKSPLFWRVSFHKNVNHFKETVICLELRICFAVTSEKCMKRESSWLCVSLLVPGELLPHGSRQHWVCPGGSHNFSSAPCTWSYEARCMTMFPCLLLHRPVVISYPLAGWERVVFAAERTWVVLPRSILLIW